MKLLGVIAWQQRPNPAHEKSRDVIAAFLSVLLCLQQIPGKRELLLLFFVFGLGLLLFLQRDFGNADLRHSVNRIALFPTVVVDEFGKSLWTSQNVSRFGRAGFDFQAFIDRHDIESELTFGCLRPRIVGQAGIGINS